jgi:hypothetical protein
MRCKPNELAYIKSCPDYPQNLGKIVRTIRLSNYPGNWVVENLSPGLIGARAIPLPSGRYFYTGDATIPVGNLVEIPDIHLQPIRDQPGADETLTWTPVPTRPVELA